MHTITAPNLAMRKNIDMSSITLSVAHKAMIALRTISFADDLRSAPLHKLCLCSPPKPDRSRSFDLVAARLAGPAAVPKPPTNEHVPKPPAE